MKTFVTLIIVGASAASARAQQPTAPRADSLRLGALHADAERLDPRQRQIALNASASDLRLRNIVAARRPTIAASGQAQYQSAVTKIAIPVQGLSVPTPSHDTYDAHVNAQQSLIDPTIAPKLAVERAQLAESQAQVRTTVFARRQEVNEAFFTAALLQQRIAELGVTMTTL
jgi:hypothetical protein